MRYYIIKFVSEAYTFQDYTTHDGQIISAGKLVLKTRYLSCMQENTNWYWRQKDQQQVIIFSTQTILHPCLYVVAVKYVHDIPKIIFNRNHRRQDLRKHPIYPTVCKKFE